MSQNNPGCECDECTATTCECTPEDHPCNHCIGVDRRVEQALEEQKSARRQEQNLEECPWHEIGKRHFAVHLTGGSSDPEIIHADYYSVQGGMLLFLTDYEGLCRVVACLPAHRLSSMYEVPVPS